VIWHRTARALPAGQRIEELMGWAQVRDEVIVAASLRNCLLCSQLRRSRHHPRSVPDRSGARACAACARKLMEPMVAWVIERTASSARPSWSHTCREPPDAPHPTGLKTTHTAAHAQRALSLAGCDVVLHEALHRGHGEAARGTGKVPVANGFVTRPEILADQGLWQFFVFQNLE
jgi:hypothetical protein